MSNTQASWETQKTQEVSRLVPCLFPTGASHARTFILVRRRIVEALNNDLNSLIDSASEYACRYLTTAAKHPTRTARPDGPKTE